MNKQKTKVLIACSGGPDSMALLDIMRYEYEVSVAHVNYHHRDTAKRDEDIVRNYCKEHNIPFYLKDYVDDNKGNFQDKARVFRYEFFAELIKEHKLEKVLVAHHKDDLIETYLLQKKRGSKVTYYGLNKQVVLKGICVERPLLKFTKDELEDYCRFRKIRYGIDESNLGNDYSRNKIRHEIVEKMTREEKDKLVEEIERLNKEEESLNKEALNFINNRSKFDIEELLNYKDLKRVLRILLYKNLSDKQLDELIKQLNTSKNFEVLIRNKYLCKEYGYIEVYPKEKDYEYHFNSIEFIKKKHFELTDTGNSKEGVTLSESDFPIMVRNYREGDSIKMLYGTKKINRFFIDNKISSRERKMWPIMFNSEGTAILVPNIGCNVDHYSKHNLYMLKL
ncbi:MAG: tRNA lysidine(34) synthetase TilS [Erysipelotrichaceae bacterium]|nr:tRNA lysidine(34) synthetase TilS [Erysipelotrichaceae bacterium]